MSLKIKAGSITNLTDARFFASYGVDYIGFCFDPLSPNYISPQQALAIKGWLHNVKIVAEFANQDAENIQGMIDFLQPDVIECKSSEFGFLNFELPGILKCSFNDLKSISEGNYLFVLIDDYNGEDISTVKHSVMINITEKQNDFLNTNISAVQIKGTPESEVGVKNYDELAELLQQMIER
ncbi:MAG: hypothetical protein ACKVPJ_11270 [Chitinophagales bacterium]